MKDIDVDGRKLILEDRELPYDTLVLAAGADNFYFGHNEWKRYAPGLKSLEERYGDPCPHSARLRIRGDGAHP